MKQGNSDGKNAFEGEKKKMNTFEQRNTHFLGHYQEKLVLDIQNKRVKSIRGNALLKSWSNKLKELLTEEN